MISLIILGSLIFWYAIIYMVLSKILYNFKYQSPFFIFDEIQLGKIVRSVINGYNGLNQNSVDVIESIDQSQQVVDESSVRNTPMIETSSGGILSSSSSSSSQYPKEIVNILVKELARDKSCGGDHISTTTSFQWFNNGFGNSRISVLHSSLTEFLAIVTFPLDNTQLFFSPQPIESYFYVLGGECNTSIDNTNNSTLRQISDHIYVPTMNSMALSAQRNCTVLLYSRGLLFFILPKIIFNTIFNTLDYIHLIKFLYTITKLSIYELVQFQKI